MRLLDRSRQSLSSPHVLLSLVGIPLGASMGFLAVKNSFYFVALLIVVLILVCFFIHFEQTVMTLLVVRSSLDPFSSQQLPAVFAIGVDGLVLLCVLVKVLTQQKIYVDGFWFFFAGWVGLQGMWLVFLPMGVLGMDGSFLPTSLREWVRIFSWLMMYLLVMQLKETTSPQRMVSWLFLALIVPVLVAALQLFAPSLLPDILVGYSGELGVPIGEASRIKGTLGHPATFATFLMLFMLLTYWKLGQVRIKSVWLLLLILLCFLFVSTKSIFSLVMVAVAVAVIIIPELNLVSVLLGVTLVLAVLSLFASSEFGQERLSSISETPLLNRDMDISRAVLLSTWDYNSFNWRLAQWTYLLQAWQQYPILGYGLLTCPSLTVLTNYAHNEYVRALTEGGIVGLILFIVFLGVQAGRLLYLARRSKPKTAQKKFCWLLLAMLLAMVVGMITENIWTHTALFFYWWTLMAVAGWDWDEHLGRRN